jgi:hypothetical protein
MKTYRGNGGVVPYILNLSTKWRWVVSFTPRPLFSTGNSPWYPFDTRLSWPQSWSGRCGRREKIPSLPLRGIELWSSKRSHYNDWATLAHHRAYELSLCLTKHHTMKMHWGNGGMAPCILVLGTIWRLVVSFTPRPLYSRERAPGSQWRGGWVGPRASLDTVVKRKIPLPRIKP